MAKPKNTRPDVIVEYAGYEGERDTNRFKSYWDALRYLNKNYDEEDRERIHPDIAKDLPDGSRTYEL
jgi:hypothetical protein